MAALELDSNAIRRLILKAKLKGGTLWDISNMVLHLAVQEGYLSDVPDLAYQHPLSEKIVAAVWELVIEGIYTPGSSIQHPNLPALRITEYGQRCLDAGELTPHDHQNYVTRLKAACPSIEDTTLLYADEALETFRSGSYLSAIVMIGVAAESMLLRLVAAVHAALDTPQRKAKFDKDTKGRAAKTQHDEVLVRLKSPATRLPAELESVLTQHIDGIYDLIRRTRNDVVGGHRET